MDALERSLDRRGWLTPLVFLALTAIFFHRLFLVPGAVLAGDDLRNFFYPIQGFVVSETLAGQVPLWNPHEFAGQSLVGGAEAALFYPLNWLWLVFDVRRISSLLLVAHVAGAGWGMARLTRALGASALGGLLGGLIYGFSAWMVAQVWAGHYTVVLASAWLPWTLLAYHHALRAGTWRATLPGMAALGLSVLAGYPPLLVHAGILLVAFSALHVLQSGEKPDALALAARQLALVVAGGAALSAVQWLPVAEVALGSTRSAADALDFAGSYPLPGAQLLTLAYPNLLGSPARPESYWGSPFYEELAGFAGLWALVAVGLSLRLRDGAARLLLAVAALGVVLSLGLSGGLLVVLLRWVPLMRLFRVPGRYLFEVVFALSGLGALVFTRLQAAGADERAAWLRPVWRVWVPVGAGLSLAGAALLRLSLPRIPPEMHEERLLAMSASLAASGLVLIGVGVSLWLWQTRRGMTFGPALALGIVLLDLWRVGLPLVNVERLPPLSPVWQAIAASVPAGDPSFRVQPLIDEYWQQAEAVTTGHYNVYGYESLQSGAYDSFASLSDAPVAPNLRLLGVRYVVTSVPFEDLPLEGGDALELVSDGGYHVYRVEGGLPRAFLATGYEVIPDGEDARERLLDGDFDSAASVILAQAPGCVPGGDGGTAALAHYSANRVTLDVQAGATALLVLTDQWFPGWSATVDGQPAEILRADTVFRAVCVPPGQHTVTFDYRPASLRWGALLSLAGWAGMAGVAAWSLWRRPR